jgi:hypothetical protein
MKDTIAVPREWLEGLIERAKNAGDGADHFNFLLGYIESTRVFLKEEV